MERLGNIGPYVIVRYDVMDHASNVRTDPGPIVRKDASLRFPSPPPGENVDIDNAILFLEEIQHGTAGKIRYQ